MPTYLEALTEDHIRLVQDTGDPALLRGWILTLATNLGFHDPHTGQVTSCGFSLTLAAAITAAHSGAPPHHPRRSTLLAVLQHLPHDDLAEIARMLVRTYSCHRRSASGLLAH